MNTPRRAATAAAAVLVLAATLGACTSGSSDDPTPTPPTSSSPSTSSSPTQSPADTASDAALATWKAYMEAQNAASKDATVSLAELAKYATAPALTQAQQSVQGIRDKGYVSAGDVRVDSARTSQFSTVSDPSTTPPTYPSIHVTGCYDSVDVTLVDATGKSVQIPNRQTYFNYDATVVNANYPDTSGWRVTELTAKAVASCASSS